MKYTLSEIAAICGGRLVGCDAGVDSVTTDSRCPGCGSGAHPLFMAMRGANHDSHDFAAGMYDRGVRAFLLERPLDLPADCGAVIVERALPALQRLAAHWRGQLRATVVGITGSNGKTIVKEWIAQQVPREIGCFCSPKSYNSQLGVALSLLMTSGDEELVILEAGISEPGEMERLERMIRPDIALFTSIGDAHQEHFASLEAKCVEKMILARNARTVICHGDYHPLSAMIAERYVGRRVIDAAREPLPDDIQLRDRVSRRNAQLVVALCREVGLPATPLSPEPAVSMRLEVKDGINDSIVVNDAYSLDLHSLALALDYLHGVAMGRPRTLVISDVPQSGLPDSELYHRVASMAAQAGVDRVIGIGPRIRAQAEAFACGKEFYETTDDCIRHIDRAAVAGRALLLKGARDFRFEKLAHALSRKSHTTTLEVDLDAMIGNLNYFRAKLRPGTKLTAMVKAGSYGTGDFEVAQMLQHQGVDYLAVAFADEGVLLRERGVTMPVVVLNADADSFEQMVAYRLEPEIYSFHSLDAFLAAARHYGEKGYPIHVKLDTGMHRLGFVEEELDELAARLCGTDTVRAATVFSHLNCADMPEEDDYTRSQIARYDRMSSRLTAALPYRVIRHTANSAAIERFPEAQFDMCRLGLGLYGFGYRHNDALRPVATLRTRIVQIKHLPAGDTVGYGRAGKLSRDSVTATVPVGYADGLDRHLGCGRWSMLVAGHPAPTVGRICMDSCMIDITDIPGVREGDEAVIFSPVPGNDPETMARTLGTISYEILTSVSGRVKRIYLKE